MIQRTVLLTFAETTTSEQLDEISRRFKALKNTIPGIIEIQAGRNLAEKSKALFQLVLMVRFADQAAIDVYTVHEDHQAIVAYIRECGRLDSIGVDIEV